MKSTPLPLSIAFLDEKGVIISIDEMAPETEDNHCPSGPARFALEMNAGWFKARGSRRISHRRRRKVAAGPVIPAFLMAESSFMAAASAASRHGHVPAGLAVRARIADGASAALRPLSPETVAPAPAPRQSR